jgi:Spy/CpxP family protein refolding chaperone
MKTPLSVRQVARRLMVATGVSGLLLLAAQAPAQTPNLPRSQAEFEKMISLTADQKKKIEAVNKRYQPQLQSVGTKYRPQLAAIENKYKPKVEALKKQMAELQKQAYGEARPILEQQQKEALPILQKQQKEIEGILTPAQRAKIKQMEEAGKKAAAGRR